MGQKGTDTSCQARIGTLGFIVLRRSSQHFTHFCTLRSEAREKPNNRAFSSEAKLFIVLNVSGCSSPSLALPRCLVSYRCSGFQQVNVEDWAVEDLTPPFSRSTSSLLKPVRRARFLQKRKRGRCSPTSRRHVAFLPWLPSILLLYLHQPQAQNPLSKTVSLNMTHMCHLHPL